MTKNTAIPGEMRAQAPITPEDRDERGYEVFDSALRMVRDVYKSAMAQNPDSNSNFHLVLTEEVNPEKAKGK